MTVSETMPMVLSSGVPDEMVRRAKRALARRQAESSSATAVSLDPAGRGDRRRLIVERLSP